jgi:L-iditol 2-dehydrogenase
MYSFKMKSILVKEVGSFNIEHKALKPVSADEVLVKVSVAGVCRTDLKLIRQGHRDLFLPRVPGEEVIGAVCEKGSGVTEIECGQRMYIYPGIWCGRCRPCIQGAENLCEKMKIMGFHRDGGFAEYVVAPAGSLIPVPDGLPDEEAVFAEPLSCCLNALELAAIQPGQTIAVWGAGPAGTLLFRAAQVLGAIPYIIDPDPGRRSLINGYPAPPSGNFDICIVAVGSNTAYQEALSRINPRGRLIVFSGLSPVSEQLSVNLNQLHYHEQTIAGAYGCSYRHGKQALNFLSEGKLNVRDMISHRFSMWDLDKALLVVEKREGMKVLLYP